MVDLFQPSTTVTCKPLSEWGPVSVELLGTETKFVQGQRWRHRVITCGEGEPLLLIHGVGGHAECFARNMHNLGKHFKVYAIDALYHGFTDKEPYHPKKRHSLQVDAMVDLIDALGHDRVHVEGESQGAVMAFEFGMRFPERSGKLIFNTGIGRVRLNKTDFQTPEMDYAELAEISYQAITKPDLPIMMKRLQWLVRPADRMTQEMAEIRLRMYQDPKINDAMRKYFSVDLDVDDPWDMEPIWEEEDCKEFKPESMVYWTEFNPGEGPDIGEYFSTIVPGCKYFLHKDCAHWPQWEKPEEHDQIVIDFIKGN